MTAALRLLGLGALACAAPARAREAAPGAEVVVTGRGLAAAPGARAFDTVVIDRDRIRRSASGRLEDVLADVAGLQQFRRSDSRSANPTSQGITLRGLGGNAAGRALLVLDGVPQADPFGGWAPFPAYATDRLGEVRVTRGGGGGLWGPGALAGVVELESAAPDGRAPLAGAASHGGRGSVDARGSAALVRPGGFALLSGAYARGDGFIPTVARDRGPVDRPAPYAQASGAARAVLAAGPATEVQVNLSAFSDRRDRGTAYTANRSDGMDASVRLVGRGRWGVSALAYVQARRFASAFAAVDAARATVSPTLDQAVPASGRGARLEVSPPLGGRAALRLGADLRAVSGRTRELYAYAAGRPTRRREAGGSQRTAGLFADLGAEFGRATLTAAGRVDRWRVTHGRVAERPLAGGPPLTDARYPDRRGTEWTGRAGAAWRPARGVTVRAAAYRGWRLPTLNELFRPYRVGADAVAADPGLRPERLLGYEGGAALAPARTLTLSATLFRDRLAGAVANVTAGAGPGAFPGVGFVAAGGVYRVRRNLRAIRSRGLELDASWRPGPVGLRVAWSRADARVEARGEAAALEGLRPAQVPRDAVSATLDARRGGAVAGLTLRRVGRQYDDDQNARALRSATTLDGYLALPLARGLLLEGRAENLFDARVEAGISGPGAVERATPRTLWLGLRYGG